MIDKIRMDVPLSQRQVKFLQALACGLRPAPAAQAAGYSISAGVSLIRNPAIRAAIEEIGANLDYVRAEMKTHPSRETLGRQ